VVEPAGRLTAKRSGPAGPGGPVVSGPQRWSTGAAALALLLAIASCAPPPSPSPSASAPATGPRGGILRLAVPGDFPPGSSLALTSDETGAALDPHGGWVVDSGELLRCCLGRTLVSHVGRPTDQGGTVLRPDIAEALPEVSDDGLTWTFRIRRGIHYAPPFEDVEVTAADFVRSLLRGIPRLAEGGAAYIPGIDGVEAYVSGGASTIAGLETPDPYTLRIRLTRPEGNIPSRFAFPDLGPIPPNPADPSAPYGVATGHDDDYGRFLVATGPYMVEGAETIDFTRPAGEQRPASGYTPGRSLTLVRNPSWDPAGDALRPAYVDRIEISIGGEVRELSAGVDDGRFDFLLYAGPPPQSPLDQVERYRADPSLGQVHVDRRDFVRHVEFNLALPPFDDIHVRKALNLVLDKAELIDLAGGPLTGEPAGHIVIDSLEDDLLLTYDPYRTPGSHGDPEAAREEMRQSRYDANGDGRCDAAACANVAAVGLTILGAGSVESVTADLAQIGITVRAQALPLPTGYARWVDPAERLGLFIGLPYGKDDLNATTFFTGIFDSRRTITDEVTNGSMVGASRERLQKWGYTPMDLPTIDDRIDACLAQTGSPQVRCWAALDQHLMENVVPWAPYVFERFVRVVGPRVVQYSFDQSMAQPALDQIALAP
jgi:peptide/nickel transport system substrate-binding protein